jgi:hypothetical protein
LLRCTVGVRANGLMSALVDTLQLK